MNKNKAKGTAAETAVVNYLKKINPGAKPTRLPLAGNRDIGDVALWLGTESPVIFEVKSGSRLEIGKWLRELDQELHNAQQYFELERLPDGYLIIKPKGIGLERVEEWWIIERVGKFVMNSQTIGEYYIEESENE